MKNKNLLIGLVAFTLSVGSVFASLFFDIKPVYVEIFRASTEEWTCYQCPINCSTTGAFTCKINVQLDIPTPSLKQVNGQDVGCTVALKYFQNVAFLCDPAYSDVQDAN